MILSFIEGIHTLAKIHHLVPDFDFSDEGLDIRIRFTNPNNGKYRDYVAHLSKFESAEEAVAEAGDFIAEANIGFWELR